VPEYLVYAVGEQGIGNEFEVSRLFLGMVFKRVVFVRKTIDARKGLGANLGPLRHRCG
jgi:hypothetical protein